MFPGKREARCQRYSIRENPCNPRFVPFGKWGRTAGKLAQRATPSHFSGGVAQRGRVSQVVAGKQLTTTVRGQTPNHPLRWSVAHLAPRLRPPPSRVHNLLRGERVGRAAGEFLGITPLQHPGRRPPVAFLLGGAGDRFQCPAVGQAFGVGQPGGEIPVAGGGAGDGGGVAVDYNGRHGLRHTPNRVPIRRQGDVESPARRSGSFARGRGRHGLAVPRRLRRGVLYLRGDAGAGRRRARRRPARGHRLGPLPELVDRRRARARCRTGRVRELLRVPHARCPAASRRMEFRSTAAIRAALPEDRSGDRQS